jgi:hypothetical protein
MSSAGPVYMKFRTGADRQPVAISSADRHFVFTYVVARCIHCSNDHLRTLCDAALHIAAEGGGRQIESQHR